MTYYKLAAWNPEVNALSYFNGHGDGYVKMDLLPDLTTVVFSTPEKAERRISSVTSDIKNTLVTEYGPLKVYEVEIVAKEV
jgi:hypothetical protein